MESTQSTELSSQSILSDLKNKSVENSRLEFSVSRETVDWNFQSVVSSRMESTASHCDLYKELQRFGAKTTVELQICNLQVTSALGHLGAKWLYRLCGGLGPEH